MRVRKKANSEKIDATLSVSFLTKLLLFVGIALFALSFIDLESSQYEILQKIADPFESITRNLGLTCLSAGLVSVLVEVSTITNVVKASVDKIVRGDFPFENFSLDRLNEVNKQLVVKRSCVDGMTVNDLNNSVYVLENELLKSCKSVYYDYNKVTYIITHDADKKVFKKRAEFEFKIINKYALDNKISFGVSIIHPTDSLTKEELEEKFSIKQFKIVYGNKISNADGKICLDEKEANNYLNIVSIEGKSHSLYKYEVTFEYELNKCLWNEIHIVYEYEIPDYDIIQSYKVNHPCKVLEHTIIVKPDSNQKENWEIGGDAYTAFYFPPSDKEYNVIQSVSDTIRISFRDWSLPGAGYMITLLKK